MSQIQYEITARELLEALREADVGMFCQLLRTIVRGYSPESSIQVMNELIKDAPKGWIKKNRDLSEYTLHKWFKKSKTTRYPSTGIRRKYLEDFIAKNGGDYTFTFVLNKYRSVSAERN